MKDEITHKQILNASSNGVIATDATGRIIFINTQAEKILGVEKKNVSGTYIPDILPLTGPLVIKCIETGNPQLGRQILGKHISLVVNITPIQIDSQLKGAVCSFQGMREFEIVAKKLESYKNLNKQLETIFKSSSDGIWVCDGKGKVININSASARLNGIKAKDVLGKNISDLVAKGLFDRSVTLEVLETKRQVSVMQYINRTNKYLLATGTPTFDENGKVCLVVVNERDMTQLNAVREELEQTHMITEKIKSELTELNLLELRDQEIVAESKAMRQVVRVALKLASIEASNVLILGETGTGKGLFAKFIHKNSNRRKKPFVQINCAALPESLLEAELFGYEKGAFTGAREQGKVGLFELAHKGTLFLDEIGDLPLQLQAKFLKYLDDFEIMRVGGIKSRKIDCSIIAATNRDLEKLVNKRRFRQDLYYRLNTFTIKIPPLRARPEDIFELVNHFLSKYNKMYGFKKQIFPETLELLQAYPFKGNVRELKNILKKAVIMSDSRVLDSFIERSFNAERSVREQTGNIKHNKTNLNAELIALERDIIKNAMERCKSTRELATELGVSQPTVVRKMKKHGLSTR